MNFRIYIILVCCFMWTLNNKSNAQVIESNKDLVKHVEEQHADKYIDKRLAEVISKDKRRQWRHSNHPPLDALDEIPVRVVYEGEESASERSINFNDKNIRSRGNIRHKNNHSSTNNTIVSTQNPVLKQNNENVTVSSTEIPKFSTTTNNIKLNSTSITEQYSTERIILKRVKNKQLSKNIAEIPVSIVHDKTQTNVKSLSKNENVVIDSKTDTPQNDEKVSLSSDTTREKQIQSLDKVNTVIKTEISKVIDENKVVSTTEKYTKTLTKMSKTGKITNQQEIDKDIINETKPETITTLATDTTTKNNVVNTINKSTLETSTTKPNLQTTIPIKEKNLEIKTKTTIGKDTIKDESNKSKQPGVEVTQESKLNSSLTDASSDSEENTRKSKYIRQRDPVVPIIENTNNIYSNGKFDYSYEGGDGTISFQSGILKENDEKNAGESVVGGFSYKDKDGQDFEISYTADENGYRPVGAHLPTPPPVPVAIARALLYLATKTTPEPVTKSIQDTE